MFPWYYMRIDASNRFVSTVHYYTMQTRPFHFSSFHKSDYHIDLLAAGSTPACG